MRRRPLPLGLLVPAGLVVLVGWLAVLQYRWLGQVSEAERDQLRTSLTHSANEFARDFDHEISQLYLALQPVDANALAEGSGDDLARRLDGWRQTARFPELVSDVYYVPDADHMRDAPTLLHYAPDSGGFDAVSWPERLEPVRDRLHPAVDPSGSEGGPAELPVLDMAFLPVVTDVPALVIPMHRPVARLDDETTGLAGHLTTTAEPSILFDLRLDRSALIAVLDATYLRESMLPTLAERHFPQLGAERYRVSIVDRHSAPVLTRGVAEGTSIPEEDADVTASFFGIGLNAMRTFSADGPGRVMAWTVVRSDGSSASPDPLVIHTPAERLEVRVNRGVVDETVSTTASSLVLPDESWQLRLQHAAGSLDAAVASARMRNVWLSFGILAVLMASVGLIVLNARRAQRLAAQQMDFVATVSHELRTPLAVIRSAAQNLSAGVVLDRDRARRYGDLIEGEGRRLTEMVEQVLDYAGLSGSRQPRRTEVVDVTTLVEDALAASRPAVEAEGLEVSRQADAGLPPVLADQDALGRAVQNLIANAVKYGAAGGRLGIVVRRGSNRREPEVEIAVSDWGPGIDAEDLPHIFEPFYRGRNALDGQIHGNGLGLSLVKRIAEAHGGRLTVRSVPGDGTTFTLHLPAATGIAVPAPLTDAEPEGGRSSG